LTWSKEDISSLMTDNFIEIFLESVAPPCVKLDGVLTELMEYEKTIEEVRALGEEAKPLLDALLKMGK
jgi:hypothetical protein